jgi:predicted O-methyltransferase YrrM
MLLSSAPGTGGRERNVFATTPISALVNNQTVSPVVLDRDEPVDGNVSPYEIDVIATLVRAHAPMVLFEIGTFDGRTSLNMAANAPAGAVVYTLDLPAAGLGSTAFALELNEDIFVRKSRSGARFADGNASGEIIQLLGDSATFDFSPYHGQVDFMFVDGSHAYEYVKSDTIAALKMVREGGIIIWHDYVRHGFTPFPGVPRALNEFYLTDGRFHDLTQIQDTSIVWLRVPSGGADTAFRPALSGDSSSPENLHGLLHVTPKHAAVEVGTAIAVEVVAKNTGTAAWLSSDAPLGPVRLGARLLSSGGEMLDDNYWRGELPFRRTTFPGQVVTFEAEIPWDGTPERILDFDLVAEGVAWFNPRERPRLRLSLDPLPGKPNRLALQLVELPPLEQRLRELADDYRRLSETAAETERRYAELRARIDAVEAELAAMRASTSWRVTAPLRATKGAIWRATRRR